MLALRNKLNTLLVLLAVAVFAPVAFATAPAAVDVSGVVDAIDATIVPIGLIGAAVLLVIVAIKTYKWVRRAM